MANPEHLKILKQGVEEWNRWRRANRPQDEYLEVVPDLSGSDLERAKLKQVDLRDADLRNSRLNDTDLELANLQGANLAFADLSGSNLTGASLRYAMVIGAFLRNATLDGASFERAIVSSDFAQASLRKADFSRASIATTHFLNADLTGADFSGANLFNSTLCGIDLATVIGLDQVFHLGPSSVGVDTLERTANALSTDLRRWNHVEVFLRGTGIPDDLIKYYRSRIGKPIEFFTTFISYSHADKLFAHRLHDRLQDRGTRCWLDEHNIKPGDRILEVVSQAIRVHDKVLLCCSETSLNSWWVKDEIRKAQERERRDGYDIIIPLNLDGFLLQGWEDGLAADLRSRLAADFTGWEHDNARFEVQFERVIQALRTDGARVPKPNL